MTTDDVAEALVVLTAAIAAGGGAEAVTIPIVSEAGDVESAGLVIGVGNDVLSAPTEYKGEAPDFSEAALSLRAHRLYPVAAAVEPFEPEDPQAVRDREWDPDLEGF